MYSKLLHSFNKSKKAKEQIIETVYHNQMEILKRLVYLVVNMKYTGIS